MGNVDSSEDGSQNFVMTMGEKYSFFKEMNDIRFGDIQIYREKAGDQYVFMKNHWITNED